LYEPSFILAGLIIALRQNIEAPDLLGHLLAAPEQSLIGILPARL